MNCPHCGRPTDAGAAFCGNCGQSLGPDVVQTTPERVFISPEPVTLPPANESVAPTSPVTTQPFAVSAPEQPVLSQPVSVGTPSSYPAAGPGQLPAYAQQAPPMHPGEVRAIVGLILGVISLPGALIPFLGLGLAVAAIIIASLSFRVKRILAILALVFGSIGVVLAILAFIYNIQHLSGNTHLSNEMQTIDTTCYSTKISKDLHITRLGGCNFKALSATTAALSTTGYAVSGGSQPNVTEVNFADQAAQAAQTVVDSGALADETYTIIRQQSDSVGGKPSYVIDAKSDKNRSTEIEFVLTSAPNGQNLFVLINTKIGTNASVAPLADNMVWK